MTKKLNMTWELRRLLAAQGIYQTTKLGPLLEERGIHLSREQVYRLVTQMPQRLNTRVLLALCEILECEPGALLEVSEVAEVSLERRIAGDHRGSMPVGDLRPIPAVIRRPPGPDQ